MGCAAPNPLHWQDLRARPAAEILTRAAVTPAGSAPGCYQVRFLDQIFEVDAVAERVRQLSPAAGPIPSEELQILLIRYLFCGSDGRLSGREVTEKELPGGPTFFRGPHALPVQPILRRFGADPAGFAARGQALGGQVVAHGDAAVLLAPFPEFPLTLILWQADEEFPASASVLLDSSICRWFELDMVFLLVRQVSARLAG